MPGAAGVLHYLLQYHRCCLSNCSVSTSQVVKYFEYHSTSSNLKSDFKMPTGLSWLLKTNTYKVINFGHVEEKQRNLV